MRLSSAFLAASALLLAGPARAYPWMIRHEYPGCTPCHADPSGSGLITAYGRAQGEILLRTHYTRAEEEPGKVAQIAYGLASLPDNVLLQASSRTGYLQVTQQGAPEVDLLIQMQADLRGQVSFDKLRVNASIATAPQWAMQPAWAVLPTGAQQAWITNSQAYNLISREHWLGFDASDKVLIRAGHFQLPFGVRDIEHDLWVRSETRTDYNQQQQDGLSVCYVSEKLRGELMGIAGNLQVSPDVFRERGYSGFLEFEPTHTLAIGYSSLIAHAAEDPITRQELLRQAHGVFLRAAPIQPVVVMAEEDLLANQPGGASMTMGSTGMAQVDYEPIQGVHLIGTGEYLQQAVPGAGRSVGYWGTLDWFFASHTDFRLDLIQRTLAQGSNLQSERILLWQLHYYL